jgi:hypothetical protein
METNWLCKLFGHKWIYYKIDARDYRVCRCCHQMNHWTVFYPIRNPFWMITVQYKDAGAKAHVKGYGK